MSAVQIAYMMHDLLQALVHLHSYDVIHRDVKLANIFFDHGQKALLGDLGIAIFINRRDTVDRLGTHGWMAPEYCDATHPFFPVYGTKIDVWASSQVLACAFERKFEPDGLGLTSEGISPWMSELYQHTSDHNVISRWTSTTACTMMTRVQEMEEREMVQDMRPPLRSDPSFSSGVSCTFFLGSLWVLLYSTCLHVTPLRRLAHIQGTAKGITDSIPLMTESWLSRRSRAGDESQRATTL